MSYDASEQLENVSVQNWYGAPTDPDEHFYQYDAAGNRTSEQRGGAVRQWEKNEVNQLTLQSTGGWMLLKGGVNVPSNVTVTPLPIGSGATVNAAVGSTEWKAKVNVGAGVNEFNVSATQANVPQGQTAQETTRKLQVLVGSIGPEAAASQYDGDGNLLSDGVKTYTWDAENRLVAVQGSNMGRVEFAYDAFNRRVSLVEKPDTINANKNMNLLWEGLTIVGQVDTTPSVNQHTRLFFGNGERRLFHAGAPLNLLYTRDHLGSIRELVDASNGAVRAAYDYTPYGIRSKLQSIGGDLESDFGYTGHYTNARTGLVLAPFRAYSPELGRWISRDPIEEAGGINLYGYVHNGPLGAVDPLGLASRGSSGHHIVPFTFWKDLPDDHPAAKVFKSLTIPCKHNFGDGHSGYNNSVGGELSNFLKANGLSNVSDMSGDHAKAFGKQIANSESATIRDFNTRRAGGAGNYKKWGALLGVLLGAGAAADAACESALKIQDAIGDGRFDDAQLEAWSLATTLQQNGVPEPIAAYIGNQLAPYGKK